MTRWLVHQRRRLHLFWHFYARTLPWFIRRAAVHAWRDDVVGVSFIGVAEFEHAQAKKTT